jgi:hypothetical protein
LSAKGKLKDEEVACVEDGGADNGFRSWQARMASMLPRATIIPKLAGKDGLIRFRACILISRL